MSFWNQHLKQTNQTYWQHLIYAWFYGFKLLIDSITSFIHGLFPWWFELHSVHSAIKIYKVIQKKTKTQGNIG